VASLARVISVNKSSYGYESYVVKYLADPPVSEIETDCVLPFQVKRVFTGERLKKQTRDRTRSMNDSAEDVPEERLVRELERTMVEAWYAGMRNDLFGKKE